jgi:hypothetical protein
MSVLYRFSPGNLTVERYEEVKRRLADGGHWPPEGMELHTAFGPDGQMKVSEIWASTEDQAAFAEHLMPVLEAAGVELSSGPEVLDVYALERF